MVKKFKKVVEWNFDSKDFFCLIGGSIFYMLIIWVLTLFNKFVGLAFIGIYLLLLYIAIRTDKAVRKVYWVEVKK